MSLENINKKLNEIRADIDDEVRSAVNVKTAEIRVSSEKEVYDRFQRELDTLAQLTAMNANSSNLHGLSNSQAVASAQNNINRASIILALVDYFKANPTSTGTEFADYGLTLPQGIDLKTIKVVAQGSGIFEALNANRGKLSIGIMALRGKA